MPQSQDSLFAGSVPDLYDQYLVPLIFEPYAADLASRTAALDPSGVLEVAAGSGVVTRAVAPVLRPTTRLVVTDLNQAMLDRASAMQPNPEKVEWQVADALDLPFPDDSFDLVLCQFGAMFFPDRVRGYSEAKRVLSENGTFIFSMWDRIADNEFADEVTNALSSIFPEDPPDFLARTPHGHHDPSLYEQELQQAGFGDINVEALVAISEASGPEVPAIAYCQGTPLRSEIESRDGPGLAEATGIVTDAIARRFGTGKIEGRVRGFVVAAR